MRLLRISLLCFALLGALAPAAGAVTATGGTAATGGSAPAVSGSATGGSVPTGRAPAPTSTGTTTPSRTAPTTPAANAPAGPGQRDVPAAYLRLYRAAAKAHRVDWRILAAIGKNESDHGRSRAPGVLSGLNYARCCAGPMQFCTTRSCGNTWGAYGVDGNGDGRRSVYDPADAIPAAARLVSALTRQVGTRTDLVLASYNAGPAYAMRHRRVPPYTETQRYVRKGLAYIATL